MVIPVVLFSSNSVETVFWGQHQLHVEQHEPGPPEGVRVLLLHEEHLHARQDEHQPEQSRTSWSSRRGGKCYFQS